MKKNSYVATNHFYVNDYAIRQNLALYRLPAAGVIFAPITTLNGNPLYVT